MNKDRTAKFLAYEGKVSVICSKTTDLIEYIRNLHDLTPTTSAALGRFATISGMMGHTEIKEEEDSLTIQLNGKGETGALVSVAFGGVFLLAFEDSREHLGQSSHIRRCKNTDISCDIFPYRGSAFLCRKALEAGGLARNSGGGDHSRREQMQGGMYGRQRSFSHRSAHRHPRSVFARQSSKNPDSQCRIPPDEKRRGIGARNG